MWFSLMRCSTKEHKMHSMSSSSHESPFWVEMLCITSIVRAINDSLRVCRAHPLDPSLINLRVDIVCSLAPWAIWFKCPRRWPFWWARGWRRAFAIRHIARPLLWVPRNMIRPYWWLVSDKSINPDKEKTNKQNKTDAEIEKRTVVVY